VVLRAIERGEAVVVNGTKLVVGTIVGSVVGGVIGGLAVSMSKVDVCWMWYAS